jgi:hypothetical protein
MKQLQLLKNGTKTPARWWSKRKNVPIFNRPLRVVSLLRTGRDHSLLAAMSLTWSIRGETWIQSYHLSALCQLSRLSLLHYRYDGKRQLTVILSFFTRVKSYSLNNGV